MTRISDGDTDGKPENIIPVLSNCGGKTTRVSCVEPHSVSVSADLPAQTDVGLYSVWI